MCMDFEAAALLETPVKIQALVFLWGGLKIKLGSGFRKFSFRI